MSLLFMLVVAGYINYKYNPEREKNLGQTIYVNGKDSFKYENVSIYGNSNEEKLNSNQDSSNAKSVNSNVTDKKEINNESDKTSNDSISVFRYDRDNMFSEMSENYNKIIANENTSKDQVNEYQKKLNSLIEEKNLITMVENVIKSKGIDDIVIIPTSNDNINVVISSKEELKKDQIAIIQQILVDQLGANAKKISITTKN